MHSYPKDGVDRGTEIHPENSQRQRHSQTDRKSLRSTKKYSHKIIPRDTKAKTQTCPERHTHARSQTHRNVCTDTPSRTSSPLPNSGCPLPRIHNPPCSLGRCPHAGRAGPSRGPPPAHSGCPCGLPGTRSSGNCPCPHTAHLSDTALPAVPLRRGEQCQARIGPSLPASLTASPNIPAGISHQGLTHTPLGCHTAPPTGTVSVTDTLTHTHTFAAHTSSVTHTAAQKSSQLPHGDRDMHHPGPGQLSHVTHPQTLSYTPPSAHMLCHSLIRLT